jgi:threonyl-tRNA synthetase
MSKKMMIRFPDGNIKGFDKGITLETIAESISISLKKKAIAGIVNGELYDLRRSIEEDAEIELILGDSKEGMEIMRHSAAHVLAQAVRRIYGEVNLGVGPVIENGFYYDLDMLQTLSNEDLLRIEKEMKKIIAENSVIERMEVTREEAKVMFQHDPLKLELLEIIPGGERISLYKQEEFIDLCRGPHVPSTGFIKAFALTKVSGAYWRGDSNNKVLQRVYGVAFASQKQLDDYHVFVEEAAKRNHRKLGSELELFMFSEEAPGMPFYLPKGQIIRNELESFLRAVQRQHYQEVRTPFMMNQRLWENSGHWDHYKDNMYFSKVDNAEFALKPMNCPGHMLIYKNKLHSYRDLPIRISEFGQVHRHEFSGALNGLLRVRSFCQDDAHLFVTPEQIESEMKSIIQLIDDVYSILGFEYSVALSTRPEKAMGDLELWNRAEGALKNVLEQLDMPYELNEGDGAFYGPKIDFYIKDALNRSHQCATVQLDFQMPEKFDLHYVDANNEKQRPVVIHRAILGSIDRFLGILIEHFAGAFPTWLAPVQVMILPVSHEVHGDYVRQLEEKFRQENVRVEVDLRNEKLGYKIREAEVQKIPYILIVGDEELNNNSVNIRRRGKQKTESQDVEGFLEVLRNEIENKVL